MLPLLYETVMLYAKAVEKAGSVEPEKVVTAIGQVEVNGPIGVMRVEAETHHAVLPNYLARVTDSAKLEILKSYEPKPPVAGCKFKNAEGGASPRHSGTIPDARPPRFFGLAAATKPQPPSPFSQPITVVLSATQPNFIAKFLSVAAFNSASKEETPSATITVR